MLNTKKLCVLFALTVLCAPMFSVAVSADTSVIIYYPSKDTYIQSPSYDANWGLGQTFHVGASSSLSEVMRGLVQFDLPSEVSGKIITSAVLKLHCTIWSGGSPYGMQFRACRVTHDWVEGNGPSGPLGTTGATWNQYDKSGPTNNWTTPGGDYTIANSSTATWAEEVQEYWLNFTMTNVVQGWAIASFPNYGFLIKLNDESTPIYNGTAIWGKDSGIPAPDNCRLDITYGNFQEGGYTYTVSGTPPVATITGYSGPGGAITIPSTLGGYPVVAIGEGAFYLNLNLDSVTIPSSVTSIGIGAFCSSSLVSIAIPSSVTSIGLMAFSQCSSLTSVSVPSSVTFIGDYAFRYCPSLTTINVDAGNPNYASVEGVLYDKAITKLIQCPGGKTGYLLIPDGVATIGEYAFSECTSIAAVSIPSSVTYIKNYAFLKCSFLSSVIICGNVASIGIEGFASCDLLAQMYFQGNAPVCDLDVFYNHTAGLTVYYLIGKTGFTNPWYGVDAVGLSLPTAPSTVQAAISNSHILLTWAPPSSNGGTPIIGYTVYRGLTSGGKTPIEYTSSDVLTYSDASVVGGQTYYYTVSASSALGEGASSSEISVTLMTVPSAPLSPSATSGATQIILIWAAPNSDGGSPITNYKVYDVSSSGSVLVATLGNVLTYTVTSLTNGQTYFYRITALNSMGESPASDEVFATPVIPEFPSFLVLSVFLIVTMMATIFLRRRYGSAHQMNV